MLKAKGKIRFGWDHCIRKEIMELEGPEKVRLSKTSPTCVALYLEWGMGSEE